jgi:hypothetical protein
MEAQPTSRAVANETPIQLARRRRVLNNEKVITVTLTCGRLNYGLNDLPFEPGYR